MSAKQLSFGFLTGLILILYLIKIPILFDEYTMGRFILWSLLSVAGIWLILPRLSRLDFHLLDGVILVFYGLNLLSVSWAQNFGEAIFTAQKYLLFFLAYYLFRHILGNGKAYWAFTAKILVILTVFVVGLTSYQLVQTLLSDGLGGKAIYKVVSFSGHKNLAASFLFLLFCFNVYFTLTKKQSTWHYWLLGIQVLLIVLLRSRAVYIAMGTFTIVYASYYLFSTARLRQLALRRILPFSLVLLLFGALLIANTGVGKDYLKYFNPSTYQKSASGSERLFVWHKTLNLIEEQPFRGYGSGNWKLIFPSKNISGGFRLQEKDLVFTRVHNDFLEVWAEVGFPGLLLYLAMFGLAIAAVIHNIRKAKTQEQKKGMVLVAALIGYAIIAFFDFPKERPEHQVLLALLTAMCATKGIRLLRGKKLHFVFSGKWRTAWLAFLTLLLAVNIPIGYYRTVADACSEKIIAGMGTRNAALMRDQSQKAHSDWCDLNIMVIPFKWYEGLSYYFEENYALAEAPFAEAYRLNPYNFNVLNNYASTLVQLQKYQQAVPLYLKALAINPKFEEGMFNLAFSYFHLQEYQSALNWVNKVERNTDKKTVFLERIRKAMEQN